MTRSIYESPFRRSSLPAVLAVGLLFALLPPGVMAQDDDGEASFSGQVLLGWRSTDVNGAQGKYRQHVNLDDGARLFGLHMELVPGSDLVDLIEVDLNNFGGDPFEGFDLDVRKFGRYHLNIQRRESIYFYEDFLIDPADANVRLSNLGDLHHFNIERVQDRVSLDVTLNPSTQLAFFFDRFTRLGEQTTVFDISRDEFELDQRVDESMNAFGATLTHRFDNGSSLVLTETIREYDNLLSTLLPGASLGENLTNNSALDFYFLDQPYDFTTFEHRVAYSIRPSDRWTIDLSAFVFDLDQDGTFDEYVQGTDFGGNPLVETNTGDAGFERQNSLIEAEFSYLINERWAFVGSIDRREVEQDVNQRFAGEDNRSEWNLEMTTFEAGVQVAATEEVNITFGALVQSRDVTSFVDEGGSIHENDVTTDHTGGFARVDWKPSRTTALSAHLENSQIDDPFALTSPTDRTRFTLRGRTRLENGFFLTGEALVQEVENDNTTWVADQTALQLDLGRRADRYEVGVGYRLVDNERSIGPELDGAFFLVPVAFESEVNLLRGHFIWKATDKIRAGVDLRTYENDGSFELERDDHRAWLEFDVGPAYLARIGYRTVDYSESVLSLNDYDADILELSIGYRWN